MSRLRGLAVNLLLSVFVCVLSAGALEGLARWLEPPEERNRSRDFFPDWRRWDADFYRFGAGSPEWPPAPRTNGEGLRDSHHTLQPPPGTLRLVALGDSVTYGYELDRADAWPQQLQRLLDLGGARVEVFNTAAPGWTTRQQRIAYVRLMRKYRPGRVVVGVCLNDIPELQNNLGRPPAWLAALYQRSAVVRRAVGARAREITSVYDLFRSPDSAGVRAGFEHFFAELQRLRSETRADGAQMSLVVFPFRFQVEAGAPEPSVQRTLCDFAARQGMPCVDLLPALRPLGTSGFIDACHLSPAGTRAVAAALAGHPALGAPPSYPEQLRAARLEGATAAELAAAARPGGSARAAAVWALASTAAPPGGGRDVAVTALEAALSDADPEVRLQALRSLGGVRPAGRVTRRARAGLLATLDDDSEPLRLAAAEALWALGGVDAEVAPLAARLGHADAYVAAFVESSLARLGAASVPALTARLDDSASLVRRRAARTLSRLGPAAEPAVPRLTARLDADPDRGVRRLCARALGAIGPAARAALPGLAAAAEADDAGLRQAAQSALRRVRGE